MGQVVGVITAATCLPPGAHAGPVRVNWASFRKVFANVCPPWTAPGGEGREAKNNIRPQAGEPGTCDLGEQVVRVPEDEDKGRVQGGESQCQHAGHGPGECPSRPSAALPLGCGFF